MAADSPEFGQFSEKSPCGHVTDARNGFQERLGFAPSWGMLDGVADVVVDRVELLLEIGDVAREPSGERLVDGLAAPVGFHADHLDDLAPPTDEFGEVDPLRFPKRPCLWTHALGEKCQSALNFDPRSASKIDPILELCAAGSARPGGAGLGCAAGA